MWVEVLVFECRDPGNDLLIDSGERIFDQESTSFENNGQCDGCEDSVDDKVLPRYEIPKSD